MTEYRGFPVRHPRQVGVVNRAFDEEWMAQVFPGMWDSVIAGFSAPYRGITTDGTIVKDLYPLEATGSDVKPIREAVHAIIASLTPEQRDRGMFAVDDNRWRRWTNAMPSWPSHGIALDSMTDHQRGLVEGVMRSTLSERGFVEARDIMRTNEHLAQLSGDHEHESLGEWVYFFSVFGDPSDGAFGWQLWGHHLDLNCMVVGDQVVLSPVFMGAEPIMIDDGPLQGIRLFADDADLGEELARSLSGPQQRQAVLHRSMLRADLPQELASMTEGRMRAGAGQDNVVLPYEGIPGSDLDESQRATLLAIIRCYVERLGGGYGERRMNQVEAHLDDSHFAFIGSLEPDAPFYYRIHSPVMLIEFDHHAGVNIGNPEAERFHVHTIVRTPNGNDYGFDLLRRHRLLAGDGAPRPLDVWEERGA